jgi:hypothetical protein
MSNFIQITPFMHVEDLEKVLIFLNDVLGFETQFRARDYAYIYRENSGHANLAAEGSRCRPARYATLRLLCSRRRSALRGTEAETGHASHARCLRPVNQPYGQRELPVLAPDGNLIVFGQAIETAKA